MQGISLMRHESRAPWELDSGKSQKVRCRVFCPRYPSWWPVCTLVLQSRQVLVWRIRLPAWYPWLILPTNKENIVRGSTPSTNINYLLLAAFTMSRVSIMTIAATRMISIVVMLSTSWYFSQQSCLIITDSACLFVVIIVCWKCKCNPQWPIRALQYRIIIIRVLHTWRNHMRQAHSCRQLCR